MNEQPEVIRSIGTLTNYENGWKKEVNLISWNGEPPTLDIREWSEDHTKMSKGGVTLTGREAARLQDALKDLPEKKDLTEGVRIFGVEPAIRIERILGILSRDRNGWMKAVTIASWNEGTFKLDIRKWSLDPRRMSRGLTLSWDEARTLMNMDLTS